MEEGLEKENEAEREKVKQKGKTPVVPVINVDLPQMEEAEEEIARLKEPIRSLQEKTREEVSEKVKEIR